MGCFEDSAWSFNRLEDRTALFTFMNLVLRMVILSLLTRSRAQGDSRPTSLPRMAGQSTSYGGFMPAPNTPTCDFKIPMTLRTCYTPSDFGYRVSVVLFCVILLTDFGNPDGGSAGHRHFSGRRVLGIRRTI